MLRNYFTIAFRHFWNHKTYVVANITGLAIAIAICILAYFHLAYNFQFNEMYDATTKDVYRIEIFTSSADENKEYSITNSSLTTSLVPETPEIKLAVRYFPEWYEVKLKARDQHFKGSLAYADSGFFLMFKHKFICGNEKTALKNNTNIVLSATSAKKYFGNEDPVGKTISYFQWGSKKDFIVTGVIEQPANNMFIFDAIIRIDDQLRAFAPYTIGVETFVEIPDKKNVAVVQKQLSSSEKDYLAKYFFDNKAKNTLKLITFKDAGDRSNIIATKQTHGKWSQAFVAMIGGVALIILLIACFNYTNTSIALAGTRIKEVALRKVMGSQRKHFIIQFLLEHAIISCIAVLLSLVFVQLITPFYMDLRGTSDFSSYTFIAPFLLVVMIFTTLISGAYPAFYISNLKTSDALRKNLKIRSGNWFTYTLLTLQMTLTVAGLGMGISFANNINYIMNADQGYDMEQIIVVPIGEANQSYAGYELYKSKIIENPDILDVAPSILHINWVMSIGDTATYKDHTYQVNTLITGIHYLQTMGVKLKLGRFFDANQYSDTNKVIVNESFIKTAGIKDPLNESIIFYNRPHKIIGVVKDYMQHGVTNPIDPIVITLKMNKAGIMVVKANKNKVEEVNKFLEKKWYETFEIPYGGYPQISRLDYETFIYKLMRSVFLSVSAISLLLSLVGLYILITLIINKRTKEIGIRKVLGSPVSHIVFILGKNFIYILGIAILVGSLAGLLIAKYCFDSIIKTQIKLDVSEGAFMLSSLIIIALTGFTISLKVFRAAHTNPVENLRDE